MTAAPMDQFRAWARGEYGWDADTGTMPVGERKLNDDPDALIAALDKPKETT